jgi:hypothetical protein
MTLRTVHVLLAAALLSACSDIGEPAPAPTFLLSPATQWSGGVVYVRSLSFRRAVALPVITAGPDTAKAVLIDDTTLAVTLPEGPSGILDLAATVGTVPFGLGHVQRYGLSSRGNIGVALQAHLLAADLPDGPTLLGVPPSKYNLRTVNLRSGQVLEYDNLFPPFWGATLSDQSGLFTLADSSNQVGLWRLGGQNQATLVAPFDSSKSFFGPWRYGGPDAVTRISDSVWAVCEGGIDHYLTTLVGQTPVIHYQNAEACVRLLVYRTGAHWALANPSLIDAATGDVIHDFGGRLGVAAASADGSLLYAVHPDSVNGDSLLVIDPASFATLKSAALPAGHRALTLDADPAGDWIYLLATGPDSLLALGVFDPATLTRLGLLPLGERCPTDIVCGDAAIAVDLNLGRIDIVGPSSFVAFPAPVSPRWSFDRLP